MNLIEQYITMDAQVCHGKPCFKGTRIMVWQILELLEAGISTQEITSEKYFPQLTADHVRAALHLASEQLKNWEFVAFQHK